MISYQHDSKKDVLKIQERLKAQNFNVWIDEDNLCTCLLFML